MEVRKLLVIAGLDTDFPYGLGLPDILPKFSSYEREIGILRLQLALLDCYTET